MKPVTSSQVVVIEDEPSVAELLRDVLEAEGFSVVAVDRPGVVEALDPHLPPDLVLVDLMLPDMDGIKLAGHLRANGLSHTPMVAMSASRIMLHFAAESGFFQDTLAKPFELSALVACVGRYIGLYIA